jgi:hypothetical protein
MEQNFQIHQQQTKRRFCMKALDLCKSLAASILLAMVFTFISCANNEEEGGGNSSSGGGGDGTVTFSLDKIDSKSFTLTVNGARWNTSCSDVQLRMILDIYYNVTDANGESKWLSSNAFSFPFDCVQNSPNVMTYTFSSEQYTLVTGTVSLVDWAMDTYRFITDKYCSGCYKANPAKASITF